MIHGHYLKMYYHSLIIVNRYLPLAVTFLWRTSQIMLKTILYELIIQLITYISILILSGQSNHRVLGPILRNQLVLGGAFNQRLIIPL
jgi:hypothetical protein